MGKNYFILSFVWLPAFLFITKLLFVATKSNLLNNNSIYDAERIGNLKIDCAGHHRECQDGQLKRGQRKEITNYRVSK